MKTKLLCVVCSALLLACGNHEKSQVGAKDARAKIAQEPLTTARTDKHEALSISGLYIGMDIHAVPNAFMEIMAERELSDFGFTDVIKAADGTQCVLMYTKAFLRTIDARMLDRYGKVRASGKVDEELLTSCLNSDGVLTVESGPDNKVRKIVFVDVRDIFNAKEQSPAEFVKRLAKKYHLAEMKPDESQTGWSYTSPDRTKVEVDAKDVLGIPMIRLYMSQAAS